VTLTACSSPLHNVTTIDRAAVARVHGDAIASKPDILLPGMYVSSVLKTSNAVLPYRPETEASVLASVDSHQPP